VESAVRGLGVTAIPDLEQPEARAEASGGYLNFYLRPDWLRNAVRTAGADQAYGPSDLGQGQRVQIKLVSTDPTGPLPIGHGRGAFLGDALCRLLSFTGHQVQRGVPRQHDPN
jgi:arginyl-tRNA synthetase